MAKLKAKQPQNVQNSSIVVINTTNNSNNSNSSSFSFSDKFTPAAQQFSTFKGFVNFSIGVMNGTQLYNMGDIIQCRSTVDELWEDEGKDMIA